MSDCDKCGDCCKTLRINIPEGIHPYNQEFLKARGYEVARTWYRDPNARCPHLTEDNLCDIHAYKPIVCRTTKCPKKN